MLGPSEVCSTACMPLRQHTANAYGTHATAAGVVGEPVPVDQPLMEAGLDSIASVELRNAISTAFGLELPATATFDYPTIAALAGFVLSRQPAGPTAADTPASDTAAVQQVRCTVQRLLQPAQLVEPAEYETLPWHCAACPSEFCLCQCLRGHRSSLPWLVSSVCTGSSEQHAWDAGAGRRGGLCSGQQGGR